MAIAIATVSAQQALAFPQNAVAQLVSVTTPVSASSCNTIITTQAYTLAPGTFAAFPFNNPLINTQTQIVATIVSYGSQQGSPALSLSGQETGVVWLTVTNNDPVNSLNSTVQIAVLIYQV